MTTQRPTADLIALSADPRALAPSTIRTVLREHAIANTADGDDLTFFLDCVTVRQLIASDEVALATLCATQMGVTLESFGDNTEKERREMTTWRAFGRSNAHGICLETDKGYAEIEEGYTDHQLRVTAQRKTGQVRKKRFSERDYAKAWAEAALR